jgi:hypothetical protein
MFIYTRKAKRRRRKEETPRVINIYNKKEK